MLPKRPLGALSYSSLHTPVDGSLSRMCSSAPRSLWKKKKKKMMRSEWIRDEFGADAHLVLVEHVVGQVDDLLHVDDGADALDVHVGEHCEDQDGLHQKLPVLRLRDSVQNGLHVDGELYLSWGHLEGGNMASDIKRGHLKWFGECRT